MIRNDLHVHSVQSFCGIHTVLELAQIAAKKGIRLMNVSDHGSDSGRRMNFGVLVNKNRLPNPVTAPDGSSVIMLRGIEANIQNRAGETDIPAKLIHRFDLISAGFHFFGELGGGKERENTEAAVNAVLKNPIDILTHPCIKTFPLDLPAIVDLAAEKRFALEINNTNLREKKTDLERLKTMIRLAVDKKVRLVENSDGHTYHEIGENAEIEELLGGMGLKGDDILLNRDDAALDAFVEERRGLRAK